MACLNFLKTGLFLQQGRPATMEFRENEIYTTEQAAEILNRNPKTVRILCRRGSIAACRDRGGYFITGWALRAYAEGRSVTSSPENSFVK